MLFYHSARAFCLHNPGPRQVDLEDTEVLESKPALQLVIK